MNEVHGITRTCQEEIQRESPSSVDITEYSCWETRFKNGFRYGFIKSNLELQILYLYPGEALGKHAEGTTYTRSQNMKCDASLKGLTFLHRLQSFYHFL